MLQQDILIPEKTFSADWWENTFLKTTNSLTKTSVFKNCISKNETKIMRDDIIDIVRTLCKLRTTQFGFRVYIEGKQLTNKEMDKIYDSPPNVGESIDSWVKRTFKDKKFGMIINRGEKLNNELAKRMAYKISPLLDKVGTPILGINFTIFIGNYGWTPLGIHTDAPGESVTHFHLGPGDKTMYTWDKEQYEEIAGDEKYNNKDVENFFPHANVHPFKEGDLYYMPPNEFHIGKSDDLSIGLTLWLNNHLKSDLARKLLRVVVDQYLEENTETMKPDKNGIEDLSAAQQAIDLFKLPEDLENLSFKDFMQETFKDYRYSLYSNSGYWTRPFPKEVEVEFTMDDSIVLEKPFIIKYVESLDKENILIYVRGTKLVLNNHDGIKNLIDEINKGEEMTVKYAFSFLDNEWDESIGFYILNLLDTHNGIKKI
jgi:hypothetical protein